MATTYAIPDGRVAMAATLWTGNGASTMTITNTVNGVGMQPDMVWVKSRSNAYDHVIWNSVVGAGTTTSLNSNTTSAEGAYYGNANLTSFNSNGFSTGATSGTNVLNANGVTNVGWQWKAGGAAVSNTAGSITSSVSANTTAGFSVVTYTGNLTAGATVGHGLGVAPSMVIIKSRSATGNWITYHVSTGVNQYLYLNSTAAAATATPTWAVSSSTITLQQTFTDYNSSGTTFVAYCFAPVAGYSAFGSYTGNGSTDGPFVYLGFRPRWLMIKRSSTASVTYGWQMYDTSRQPANTASSDPNLWADTSAAEGTGNYTFDLLSNGFKLRSSGVNENASGDTYIYACFAEVPFKFANAR